MGYPTYLWRLTRADGTVIFSCGSESNPDMAEPGEELFEGWDPDNGGEMEATPWRFYGPWLRRATFGDDAYAVRNRFEAPPAGSRAINVEDDPAWLVDNNLAEVGDLGRVFEVRVQELAVVKGLVGVELPARQG